MCPSKKYIKNERTRNCFCFNCELLVSFAYPMKYIHKTRREYYSIQNSGQKKVRAPEFPKPMMCRAFYKCLHTITLHNGDSVSLNTAIVARTHRCVLRGTQKPACVS